MNLQVLRKLRGLKRPRREISMGIFPHLRIKRISRLVFASLSVVRLSRKILLVNVVERY